MGAIVTVDHILSPTNAISPMRFDHATSRIVSYHSFVFIFIEILCHILQVTIYKAYSMTILYDLNLCNHLSQLQEEVSTNTVNGGGL